MNETMYRRHRGWNGTVYYYRMSEREAEERRKLGLIMSVIVIPPVMITVFALAAGLIRL